MKADDYLKLRRAEDRWFNKRVRHIEQLDTIIGDKYSAFPSELAIIYFEEIKNAFVYEAYIATIILSQLLCMEALKAHFSMNEEIFHSGFSKLIEENEKIGLIDKNLVSDLLKLKELRDSFEHTKSIRKVIRKADYILAQRYHMENYAELEDEALFSISLSIRLIDWIAFVPQP